MYMEDIELRREPTVMIMVHQDYGCLRNFREKVTEELGYIEFPNGSIPEPTLDEIMQNAI